MAEIVVAVAAASKVGMVPWKVCGEVCVLVWGTQSICREAWGVVSGTQSVLYHSSNESKEPHIKIR